ncbi:MAG TPA: PHB depolymerase family esterase, partial [Candidatus Baltobacteraceae bacterium]
MRYRLFAPQPRPREPMPLIVALHGCTQSITDFAAGTNFESVARRAGVAVLFPEQAPLANSRGCWNWFSAKNQKRASGEPATILRLIESIRKRNSIDARRIFVVGFSAGAAMAAILAEQAPDVFAAVGLMAGVPLHVAHNLRTAHALMSGAPPIDLPGLALPLQAYRAMRVTIWQGAIDTVVAPVNATWLAHQFAGAVGVADQAVRTEYRAGAEIRRRHDVDGVLR